MFRNSSSQAVEAQANIERHGKLRSRHVEATRTFGGIVTGGSFSGFFYALDNNNKILMILFFMTCIVGLLLIFEAELICKRS